MRNGIYMPTTAFFLLTAVLFFLSGCGREGQQSDQTAAEEQRNAALLEMLPQDIERDAKEAKEKEQKYKTALEQSLDLCRDLKWFLEQAPVAEEAKDGNYEFLRQRCLAGLELYSRRACRNFYGNGEGFFERVLYVHVLSELLRRDRLWTGYQGEQPLDKFWEICRKEGIKSGRMSVSENPEARMYNLVLHLRPGYGVTQRDLEPLIVTALKQGVWKIAILPPFTVEEEERFFQEVEEEKKFLEEMESYREE